MLDLFDASDFQKARALIATLFRAADIADGNGMPSEYRTQRAITNAEIMLEQLGITDPNAKH